MQKNSFKSKTPTFDDIKPLEAENRSKSFSNLKLMSYLDNFDTMSNQDNNTV